MFPSSAAFFLVVAALWALLAARGENQDSGPTRSLPVRGPHAGPPSPGLPMYLGYFCGWSSHHRVVKLRSATVYDALGPMTLSSIVLLSGGSPEGPQTSVSKSRAWGLDGVSGESLGVRHHA